MKYKTIHICVMLCETKTKTDVVVVVVNLLLLGGGGVI